MQRQYKAMLEKGWEFTQLPWQVEAAWPTSPDLLQRALNSTSEVHSSVTELEGAVTIAECLETGMSDHEAVESAVSGNPLWEGYAKTLAELAKRYGGGHQVPLLHKLDTFSKKHGENRRLGEEFLAAVVSSFKYPDPSINLPRVVDMLLTTNMVAPKVVDGVARCITKTDVTALSIQKKLPLLQEVEGHLGEADDICAFLLKNHPSIASDKDGEFTSNVENLEGLFKVRLGAFLTKKGEATFEKKTYESIEAIIQTLLKEVYELLMKQETLIQLPVSEKWQAILAKVKEPEKKEEAEPQGSKLLSVDELTSKEETAFRAGFKPGKLIFEKAVGPAEGQSQRTAEQYIAINAQAFLSCCCTLMFLFRVFL